MRCKICQIKFVPTQFLQKTCSVDHAMQWLKLNPKKVRVQAEKFERERTKQQKEEISDWKGKLQTEVQLLCRQIDYGLLCLATGNSGKLAGGHLWSKGGHPQCRFNLHNIHRQCYYSNAKQSQDSLMWEGLEREYGREYHDMVKSLKGNPIPKHSNEDYREFYKITKAITLQMSKNLVMRSAEERVQLRNELNLKIGIYGGN